MADMGLEWDFIPDISDAFRPATAQRSGEQGLDRPKPINQLTPPSSTEATPAAPARADLVADITPIRAAPTTLGRSFQTGLSQVGLASGGISTAEAPDRKGPGYHVAANPNLTGMIGAQGKQIMAAVGKPGQAAGQWRDVNVRPAGGAKTSYHYDGLALDIGLNANDSRESVIGDRLASWVRANSGAGKPFKNAIWKSPYHYDHVHITYNEDYVGPLPAIPRFA